MTDRCAEHAWASVGVEIDDDGGVTRIWKCEHCPAWTRETFDSSDEVDWDQTWLAGM